MDAVPSRQNGHYQVHQPSGERLLDRIDQAAKALSAQVERFYNGIDAWESRVQQWVDTVESHPGRTLTISFIAGMIVGAWLTRRTSNG